MAGAPAGPGGGDGAGLRAPTSGGRWNRTARAGRRNGPGHGVARLPAGHRTRQRRRAGVRPAGRAGARRAATGTIPSRPPRVLRRALELWQGPALRGRAGRAVRPGRGRPVGRAAAGRRRRPYRRRPRAGPAQRAGGRAGAAGAAAPDAGAVAGPADARALPLRPAGRRAAGRCTSSWTIYRNFMPGRAGHDARRRPGGDQPDQDQSDQRVLRAHWPGPTPSPGVTKRYPGPLVFVGVQPGGRPGADGG